MDDQIDMITFMVSEKLITGLYRFVEVFRFVDLKIFFSKIILPTGSTVVDIHSLKSGNIYRLFYLIPCYGKSRCSIFCLLLKSKGILKSHKILS